MTVKKPSVGLELAAQHALAIEDGLAALAEWEVEHGQLTDDELARADAVLTQIVSDKSDGRDLRHRRAARRRSQS